ncbi:MAG: HD domain-containing protein [Massiliimalia sp.]|jgi:putative hydrolase of HD superfamily
MDVKQLLSFLHAVEPLKYNTRHSWTSSGRQESVAEHSWRLALMAYLVKDEFPQADIDKVILMCLVHDLGEAVTGDIPAFYKEEQHRSVERKAVHALLDPLPSPFREELSQLFQEMEAQQTVEAKLYKALDKMECLIQHNEADIKTWLDLEYSENLVYGAQETAFSPYTQALRKEINQNSLDKAAAKQ